MFGSMFSTGSLLDEVWRLQQQLDEVFGDSLGSIRATPGGTFPAVNVSATPEQVDVWLLAPGIDPKSLDISIQQNLLTIKGRRELLPVEGATYYRQERFGGEFSRILSLPEDVDPERVAARYRDGIVQITVQRRATAQARQIQIS